jgi:V/A-type H+-transporting ATPase subunit E
MENKLQELTDKLYKEGLSKGKEEGEALLAKANAESERILEQADKEAESILKQAKKEAEDYKSKVEGDVRMAVSQALQATRKDIENLVIGKIAGQEISSALSSADFVKELLRTVAGKFSSEGAVDLDVVLPEALRSQLEPFITGELSKQLQTGITANFSKKISGGFTIGPKEGGYFISFTDDTFRELIGNYLRPVTRKILFEQ